MKFFCNFIDNFFTKPIATVDNINKVLKTGENLEKKGDFIAAYFLYKGIVAEKPEVKAARSHLAKITNVLEDQGFTFPAPSQKELETLPKLPQSEKNANTLQDKQNESGCAMFF